MARLFALALVLGTSACVSFFPQHAIDPGRGAAPLEPGRADSHVTLAGGIPGGLGGFGIEGQVSDDIAAGFDIQSGAQDSSAGLIVPSGSYLTLQYNPSGWTSIAVRGAAGMGVDVLPGAPGTPVAPWLGGTAGIVTSATLGSLTPYLGLDVGARRYVGGPDNAVTKVKNINGVGLIDNQLSGNATFGLRFDVTHSFAVYGSGSIAALLLTPDSAGPETVPLIEPSGNGQLGVSCTF